MIEQIRQKASGLFGGEADRGVSPVIGVILMVAITVILAAVIGAFVLGLGDDLNGSAAPSSQLNLNVDSNDGVIISHNGGDEINRADVKIVAYADGSSVGDLTVKDLQNVGEGSFAAGETIAASWSPHATAGDGDDVDRVAIVHDPSGSVIVDADVSLSDFDSWDKSE